MKLGTFRGGVHPSSGKLLSKDEPLTLVKPAGEFVFMLSQHIGAPATAIVNVGDQVTRGQKIAEAGGFVSAPIYSSVSGTVKKIESRINTVGAKCEAIIIELDENNNNEIKLSTKQSLDDWTKEEILERVKEAGIVGLGGAGFPTHVKFAPKDPDKIEYIIVNGAECEPYITCDNRRMIENPNEIVEGLNLILKMFPNAIGIIGIEDNKPDCISSIINASSKYDKINVIPLKTKYPQGGERQLIYATTSRKINSKMLPADAGCIVDNIETVYAIYNAVANGMPLIDRSMTVSGDGINKPSNFIVPIGMSHKLIVENAGGINDNTSKIISGGPMMGFAMPSLDVPTTKTSSSLLAFTNDIVNDQEITACINCGRCVDACPLKLIPSRLAKFSDNNMMEDFYHYNGVECIECGSCSFVCPARRPLKQSIGNMKRQTLGAMKSGEFKPPVKKNKNKEEK